MLGLLFILFSPLVLLGLFLIFFDPLFNLIKDYSSNYAMFSLLDRKYIAYINNKIEMWLLSWCMDHHIPVLYQKTKLISMNNNECAGIIVHTHTKTYGGSWIVTSCDGIIIHYEKVDDPQYDSLWYYEKNRSKTRT
jgi:hypothetical protein